jgi:cytochrome c-type biogenesis protein CcmH/NrfG
MRLKEQSMTPLSKMITSWSAAAIGCLLVAAGLGGCGKNDGPAQVADSPPQPSVNQPQSSAPYTASKDAGLGVMERIEGYRQRLEKNPKDLEALIFLGNANYDIQRFEKAAEYYERALALEPKNLLVRTDLATSYRNTGKVDQAVKELKQVLAIDPKHENALYNLGFILLNDKKDTQGALKAWGTLVSENPKDPRYDALRKKVRELKKAG